MSGYSCKEYTLYLEVKKMGAAHSTVKNEQVVRKQTETRIPASKKRVLQVNGHGSSEGRAKEPTLPFSARVSSKSKISGKGQITLPALVRQRLGVNAGDEVEFFFDGERTVVRPVRSDKDPLAKWVGFAKGAYSSDADVIRELREMRGWDEWDEKEYGA